MPSEIKENLQGRPFSQASFIFHHGLENAWRFQTKLNTCLKGFNCLLIGNNQTNIQRIAQMFIDIKIEKEPTHPFRLTDII